MSEKSTERSTEAKNLEHVSVPMLGISCACAECRARMGEKPDDAATGPAQAPVKRPNHVGASSIARIAGNILSGMAAATAHDRATLMIHMTEADADLALDLARYIARKAEQPEGGEK